ncbi:unnamed protein product [Rotaria magnacalcarata]|uniref:Uncharacterized protein n=3 Tax=Rotaria magnacalcarata TaxID=392030 RepID=A0A814XXR7_9BILA|nr:unnamed protein product [Rotaria magnacalcarata]CAF1612602.1 unnamed protein product [Rotaria magnacalcarata]CAF2149543.1 unnamed protein product [Rotaria magnacalcarata]CAF2153192.1 unnamed protein product [Rotaria magnacalcarata]CAF2169807.1 unnamed protein product [Rotaria magnacalcarata]
MSSDTFVVSSERKKHSLPVKRSRSIQPLSHIPAPPDPLLAQLIQFRIDGRTIDARNVNELYPGLDRLLLRCLQTGDCRQLDNRLQRNLKAEYLLITSKHIHLSVCSHTEDILEKLVEMGATLDLHFYEPIHMKELELMCKHGFDINERISKYNNQAPLSIFTSKNYSIAMLDVLVKHGARFDFQDNSGQTCVHIACQPGITDPVFEFIINNSPDSCLNIRNQSGGTPLDLIYLSTYEQASLSRLRRLHLLLARKESKLTRYGMREPNLLAKKQFKLFDILACKEFLFKYRLKDIFDPTMRSLAWCIFLLYDVLRACEQRNNQTIGQQTIQKRLDCYLISMIENGEIPLDKLIFRQNLRNDNILISPSSPASSPTYELENQILTDTQNSLLHMAQIKTKLSELRMEKLTLKAICRIKIKKEIQTYPNDIIKIHSLSKILQAYLTYYNPFVKADVNH